MALNVGELVAYLRLDDTEFQNTLSKSGTGLQNLGQSASRLLQPLATGFAATTTAGAGVAAMLLRQGVAYNTLQQQSRAALKSITGSAEDANKQMDKLDEFARTSPFSKATFITAQQQMLGFGIEAEKVIPYLDSIQDATAAIGGSNQEIGDLAFIMAQISAAGKITGQDLLQFGQRGVNAAKLIGDQMGKTENEIRESITKGTLDADDALDMLAKGMSETYEGAAEGVKDTWVGAVDRISAASRDLGAVLASPFVDPNGGGMALDWANGLADLLRAVEAQAKPFIETLLPKMVPVGEKITATLEKATEAVNAMDPGQVTEFLASMSDYVTPIAAVGAGLFAMGTNVGILARMGLTLNPFVAALVAVVTTSEDARNASLDLVAALQPLGDEFGELLQAGGDLANTVLSALVEILGALADGADSAGGPVDILALGLEGLTSAVRFVNDIVEPLAGWLVDLAGAAEGATGPVVGITLAMLAMRNVNVGGAVTALTTSLSNAKGTWQASQGTLQALGREAGTLNTAFLTARTGAQRLGGAMKGLAVANAPMLAITALAGVIGFFMQQSAEAKSNADALADSFDDLTGAATAETDMLLLEQLNEHLTKGDWDELNKIGISYTEVVDAIKAGGPELQALNDKLTELGFSAGPEAQEAIGQLERSLQNSSGAYDTAREKVKLTQDQQAEMNAEMERAASQATATSDALGTFESALEVISDEASTADDKLQALHDIMDVISGKAVSAADGAFAYADSVRDAADAVEELELSQGDLDSILTDGGALNTQSEAAGLLRDEFKGLTDDATAWATTLAETGDVEGVRAVYDGLAGDIDALAESANLSDDQVKALKDSLGILPPEVMTDITLNGADASAESLEGIKQQITDMPDEVMTYINGDTTDIETKVNEADLRLAYVASLSADPNIGADDSENLSIVGAAVARLNEIDGMKPTPELKAEKSGLERVVAQSKLDLDSIPDKTAEVIAETFGFSSVQALKAEINRVQSKTVTVRTNFVETTTRKTATPGPSGLHFTGVPQADGGVMEFFANGGTRENHVAQIAPAGAWRVWAEEETGGEGYVPLHPSKRGRSLAVMHEIASRFGHVMVPVGAQQYANGAVNAPAVPTRTSPSLQLPSINVNGFGNAEVAQMIANRVEDAAGRMAVDLPGG